MSMNKIIGFCSFIKTSNIRHLVMVSKVACIGNIFLSTTTKGNLELKRCILVDEIKIVQSFKLLINVLISC